MILEQIEDIIVGDVDFVEDDNLLEKMWDLIIS